MFSVLKYFYYKQKVEQTENCDVFEPEPEIVNSYKCDKVPTESEIISAFDNTIFNDISLDSSKIHEKILLKEKILIKQPPVTLCTRNILEKLNTVYLVLKKNTGEPLGIFDSLSKARNHGEIATYHNCQILELKMNDPCKYLHVPIFENR